MTLAELVVKLSMRGDGEMRRGLDNVKREMGQTGASAVTLSRHIDSAARSMRAFGAAVAGGLAAAGIIAAGKAAFDAAVRFEALQARMTALTGSAALAAEKLRLVQQVAAPSSFTFSQLAEASVQLEAFGIRTERALPSIAKLGEAFAADTEHIQMLVRMFGQLSQGNFPDLEQLTAFGLSRSQFKEQGIKFDGNGKLLSGARETLDALERIVNQKYSGIFEQMQNTTQAKLASLADAWERFVATIGSGIAQTLTPIIERMSQSFSAMVDSGVLQEVVSSVTAALTGIANIGSDDGITRLMANILSFVKNIPQMLEGIKGVAMSVMALITEGIQQMFQSVGRALMAGIVGMSAPARAVYGGLFEGLAGIGQSLASMDISSQMSVASGVAMGVSSAAVGDPLADSDAYYNRMKKFMKPGDTSLPEASGAWGKLSEIAQEQDDKLGDIATNTRETRDFLALRQQALGGGNLARIGVSGAELASAGAGRMMAGMGFGGSNAVTGGNQIERHIRRIIQDEVRRTGGQPMRRS